MKSARLQYPVTNTVDASDIYFGRKYADPYRWLENLQDKQVKAWFKSQADLSEEVLSGIPGRDMLVDEWLALDKQMPGEYSAFNYRNGRLFYKKTAAGENVARLFLREGWDGEERLLFDPSSYSSATTITIHAAVPSWDGRHVALGLSSGGAEYSEIRILDVETENLLPEALYPSMGPLGWTPDNGAFFYEFGNVTDLQDVTIQLNRKTRLHKLNSDGSRDIDVFGNVAYPELGLTPKELPFAFIDESQPDIIIGFSYSAENEMRIFHAQHSDLATERIDWKVLCTPADMLVRGLILNGDEVYAVTHLGAPNYRLVRTNLKNPEWSHAETIIPEATDCIQSMTRSKNFLLIVYSNGIVGRLVKYDMQSGATAGIELPASGTVSVSCPQWDADRCLVSISSWTSPVTIYDFDPTTEVFTKSIFSSEDSYPRFKDLVAEEVEVQGHDGTMIPLSIVYRQGLARDGSNCCILCGYGAYGCSILPYFSITHSVALRDVVLAFAHVRGGGEKGEAWYKAGYKTSKANTWKDFISCAEYLVRQGYTRPEKLAGEGSSAGGILISRAITERPDLFAAALCNVGCANTMRMEFSANGPANTPEFGTVEDPIECEALYEMDGLQHVGDRVRYPAVLGVAGWNDPRVAPWETAKFVAALQSASTSDKPVLLKINYDSGHIAEEKHVNFRNFASQYAFLLWQSGHEAFQPALES